MNNILQGDCINRLKELDDISIDAIVTDPPYELGFMGKKWDNSGIAYNVELWSECLRVLKPGGHLLSFGGTRTYHRMTVAIEDAGFEIRDMLEWIYASGFPKSQNVGKAYDKKMGNEREEVEPLGLTGGAHQKGGGNKNLNDATSYATGTNAKYTKGNSQWEGYGTALKPAHEPIVLARKPLSEKTIVENCIKHGTGALDIDGCRIPVTLTKGDGWRPNSYDKEYNYENSGQFLGGMIESDKISRRHKQGRFPANLLVTDDALGEEKSRYFDIDVWAEKHGLIQTPKASKSERNAGCEKLDKKRRAGLAGSDRDGNLDDVSERWRTQPAQNNHPTVKPIHLMSWLVRLVSKKGDTVLDPFMGSGTTGVACKQLDRNFIGIELNEEYIVIAEKRISHQPIQKELFV